MSNGAARRPYTPSSVAAANICSSIRRVARGATIFLSCMTYTVVGAGAIGGTVAAHMLRGGEDVLLVDADAAHVEAMRTRGLTIRGADETFNVPVQAVMPDQMPARLEQVL